RYSGKYRPACRIIQTGVRSTGWRRHARSSLSFIQNSDDTIPGFMEAAETSVGTDLITPEDGGKPTVSIVVPAFNEAGRISESVKKIDAFACHFPLYLELIVVDDGSGDQTAQIVRGLDVKGLRVIRNHENHGKGYAVRQGVLAACGKYVLFTDADLSAPIEELNKLLDVAVKEGADVVIGSRAVDRKYIEKHQSLLREAGGIAFNFMVRLLLGLRLHD